ncbi:MAG: redox-sensing transcriptional repressor Rex, partial [Selenomonas artemidis]
MQENSSISKATVDRLPRYYRCLRLLSDEGIEIASSEELGRRIAVNPEQIRKDLAFFGQFGKKGVGYYVAELQESIGAILGLDRHWNIAVVGMGHLGVALANYQGIARLG